MKKEAMRKWYYVLFDEITGGLYEEGEFYSTRAEAFERIQELHYFFLDELKKAGKKTAAEQLRSIIKEDQEAAIREYKCMIGRSEGNDLSQY